MKTTIKVRNHTHVFEPAGDKAYKANTIYEEYKRWWIEEMAMVLALIIPGADPLQVCARNSPFYRAAKDMWFYTKEDIENTYWSFRTQPIYEDNGIGIVYIRNRDHRPEIKWYRNNENT